MPTEQSSDVKFEIGHVLFIDIVGYSKLLITEQSNLLDKLKEIVRGTEQFRIAKAEGKLLALADWRRRRACFSHQPGSASALRDGDQQAAKTSSRTASANGYSQRPG